MDYKKCSIGVLLIILLLVGARSSIIQALVQVVPDWVQVNSNGFGDVQAVEVSALETFNGHLYAGTYNPVNDARIFRSSDGTIWTAVIDPGFGSDHDTAPRAILDMAVFKGYLYASTGRGNASQIWRSSSGLFWGQVVTAGFGDADTVDFTALTVYDHGYDQAIYVGATNQVSGAQIWRSFTGNSNDWTQVAPTVVGTAVSSVTGFAEFDGGLYAAVAFESDTPAQIWRSYGGDWTTIVSDGFGDSNITMTGGMAVFDGYLYVGAGNTASGAQLWRSNDGTTWGQAVPPAFGDANNVKIEMVSVFQNQLYVSVQNSTTGIEIWRSADGSVWEQVNVDGFGDVDNTGSNVSNATAVFLNQLYVGTMNVADGGELWQMQNPYGVALSPDDALSGTAGQDVTYTLQITNTGSMTDTFDLALSGNSWETAVFPLSITLNPGVSDTISVTVPIPAGTLGNDSDLVSITATSQGNPTKSDSAQLTTSVLPVYALELSPGYSLSGLPGETVSYTLTISNSGNITDTYAFTSTGNAWETVLSSTSMVLAPGTSGFVTTAVTVPANAPNNATDMVTITATSQEYNEVQDNVILTTKCLDLIPMAYLPMILRMP